MGNKLTKALNLLIEGKEGKAKHLLHDWFVAEARMINQTLSESMLDNLETVNVGNTSEKLTSPVGDRTVNAKPVKIKGDENTGHSRETPPKVDTMKDRVNNTQGVFEQSKGTWEITDKVLSVIEKYYDDVEVRDEGSNAYFLFDNKKIHFTSTRGPVFGAGFSARIIDSNRNEKIIHSPYFSEFLELLENYLSETQQVNDI